VILIDEKEGRRCALARGFVTAGTLNPDSEVKEGIVWR
jgi:hypothetical protein